MIASKNEYPVAPRLRGVPVSVTVTGARGQHSTAGWASLAEERADTSNILPASPSIIPVSFQCHPSILPASPQYPPSVSPISSLCHPCIFSVSSQYFLSAIPVSSQHLPALSWHPHNKSQYPPSNFPASSQYSPSIVLASSQYTPSILPASSAHLPSIPQISSQHHP